MNRVLSDATYEANMTKSDVKKSRSIIEKLVKNTNKDEDFEIKFTFSNKDLDKLGGIEMNFFQEMIKYISFYNSIRADTPMTFKYSNSIKRIKDYMKLKSKDLDLTFYVYIGDTNEYDPENKNSGFFDTENYIKKNKSLVDRDKTNEAIRLKHINFTKNVIFHIEKMLR